MVFCIVMTKQKSSAVVSNYAFARGLCVCAWEASGEGVLGSRGEPFHIHFHLVTTLESRDAGQAADGLRL